MKKVILMYMGLALCLLSVLFAGCGDKEKEKEQGGSGGNDSSYKETAFGMEMAMVWVKGGTFMMGATEEQGSDAYDNEKPVHSVTLDDFYIGKYEVTQAQWEAVMGTTVEQQRDKASEQYGVELGLGSVGDACPMYYISLAEAREFCKKLSQKTGKTYRLPTEAEWEYAARGGQYADGTKYAGSNTIGDVAWCKDNSGSALHPVGLKAPNGLGLYDMSGNIHEWCSDWYGDYSSSSATNPQGPSSGEYRLMRGGDYSSSEFFCRISHRMTTESPGLGGGCIGFRVVCER